MSLQMATSKRVRHLPQTLSELVEEKVHVHAGYYYYMAQVSGVVVMAFDFVPASKYSSLRGGITGSAK